MNSPIRPIRPEDRSLASIFSEIREEIFVFLETRSRMVKAEVQETLKAAKIGLPLIGTCLVLVVTGFLLLTAAIVTIIAGALAGNAYAWFYAFLIAGFAWTVLGVIAGMFGLNQFRRKFPKQTVAVLKADKEWLKHEIRSFS